MSYYCYAAIAQNFMLSKHNLCRHNSGVIFYLFIFPRIFTHSEHYSNHKYRSKCHLASAPTAIRHAP